MDVIVSHFRAIAYTIGTWNDTYTKLAKNKWSNTLKLGKSFHWRQNNKILQGGTVWPLMTSEFDINEKGFIMNWK